jgi:hypothetical protein
MNAFSQPSSPAPDLIEPVVEFRQWRLAEGSLRSLYSGVKWPTSELQASCALGLHDPADTPSKACSCRIYAYYGPCPRTASAATPDFVGGAVILWGSIEVHGIGMRAAHARIVGLELPISHARKPRDVVEVAERLAVPAVAHRDMKKVAAAHGLPLKGATRPPRSLTTISSYQASSVLGEATSAPLRAGRGTTQRKGKGGLLLSQEP